LAGVLTHAHTQELRYVEVSLFALVDVCFVLSSLIQGMNNITQFAFTPTNNVRLRFVIRGQLDSFDWHNF
jgi:hypothetical protein